MEHKHAYCIMAHNNWHQLQRLIDLLDDPRNDIYLHIDIKSLADYHQYGGVKTKASKLHLLDTHFNVAWGNIVLSDTEVKLFETAIGMGVNYRYIHLISGCDLPLRNQDEMHAFFDHRDEEFLDVQDTHKFEKRIKYYHFFTRSMRKSVLMNFLRRLLLIPQLLFVNRLKDAPLQYAYGSEWCSLTPKAVRELVTQFHQYRYMFEKSTSGDELYKQMILTTPGKDFKIAKEGNLRFVIFDHKQLSPRTLSMREYPDIMQSGCMFARKFEEGTEAYEKIYQQVSAHKCNLV